MQIVFWGAQPWQSGVVGNMIGTAFMMTELCGSRSLMMQTRFSCPDLDYALFPDCGGSHIREEGRYFQEIGLDAVLNDAILKFQQKERFPRHIMEVKKDRLYYLPGTYKHNREVFEHHLLNHLELVLEAAEYFGENLFLDCSGESGMVCERIMELADVIVINVPQNPHQIEKLPSLILGKEEKLIYLIGQHNEKSKYHINNIRRRYHIPKEQIAAIPYNVEFDDALSEGKSVRFLEQNLSVKKKDFNYELIQELREATELIIKKAEQRTEERNGT